MNEQDKEQQAKEAWRQHFINRFYLATPEYRLASMALLSDFQSAIIEALNQRFTVGGIIENGDVPEGKVVILK